MTGAEQLDLLASIRPAELADAQVFDAFAGPGGWDEGAKIVGLDGGFVGVELDRFASATAVAAGHRRLTADVQSVEPWMLAGMRGCVVSSPCPTFSDSGKRTGRGIDYQVVLDVITHVGSEECRCSWEQIERELDVVADPRTALAAQTIRLAMLMPDVEWLAFEQVPAAEYMFEDIAAELFAAGWESADVMTIEANDFGLPVRRKRVFLVARRYLPLGYRPGVAAEDRYVQHPGCAPVIAAPTMAEALSWEAGHRMRTRGNRRTSGGNLFRCDGPAWCLTEKARSWTRDQDGLRLTAAEAGLLQGFRADYPWQGSRSRQFLQAADVVCPPVAAAVLGYVNGIQWQQPVADYLTKLYRDRRSIDAA